MKPHLKVERQITYGASDVSIKSENARSTASKHPVIGAKERTRKFF